ncbi:response regulator [Synechocystis sp. PCC 6714]|uniref:response regulator n=2 Tax=unclassified Synechocystis TaxID=2640012 RepID=UPI000491342F|nr:response regulator [Synechocystis sp. PCC 6714]AIE72542.2 PatA subfamily [Synechocystis sp. PCC 6714]MCT0254461.1 response regulator [Synechocystis sp. CS-94]
MTTLITKQVPSQFLQTLIAENATGRLMVHNPMDELVTWQVYLGKGKINFANSGVGSIQRVQYLLGNYLNKNKISLPPQITDDYKYICELWKKEVFSFQQTRSILTQFTQEALVQFLALPSAECSFNQDDSLKDLFLNLDLDKTIQSVEHKIRYWGELHPHISSPFQRPLVENWQEIKAMLNLSHRRSEQWCEQLLDGLKNLSCLYELARKTNSSALELALFLHPQIKSGEIKMLAYQELSVDNYNLPVVISVNNRPSVQEVVRQTLGQRGFKVVCIDDPCHALAAAISHNPQLILIDAEMPEISGYELCRLLRKSSAVRETPIILLNQNDGVMEQIQGRLAKASGQINKQFLSQQLLQVRKDYLNSPPALCL